MSNSYLTIAALIALGAGAPALATAAQAPAAKPAAKAQPTPTRASFIRTLDNGFKAIDSNGDGNLTSVELQAAETKVQQNRLAAVRTRVESEFTKLDTNKDNQLSKAEFMAAAPKAPATPPNGAKIVAQLDKNKDGKITVDEYRAPRLSAFDKVDTNKDGTLSVAERQAATAAARNR